MANYKIEALWDCSFCGGKGIKGRCRYCPDCGSPRDKDVEFYLPEDISIGNAVDETIQHVTSGPDWLCGYCGSYCSCEAKYCTNCGSSRAEAEKNYNDIKIERSDI